MGGPRLVDDCRCALAMQVYISVASVSTISTFIPPSMIRVRMKGVGSTESESCPEVHRKNDAERQTPIKGIRPPSLVPSSCFLGDCTLFYPPLEHINWAGIELVRFSLDGQQSSGNKLPFWPFRKTRCPGTCPGAQRPHG